MEPNPIRKACDPRGNRKGFASVGLESVCTVATEDKEERLLRDALEGVGAVDLEKDVYDDVVMGKTSRIVRIRGYKKE